MATARSVNQPLIPSSIFGTLLFIATEIMFFSALISAYTVIRAKAPEWPPLNQPRLGLGITAANTIILFLSGVSMLFSGKKAKNLVDSKKYLLFTILLGSIFISVQGYEWVRLISFGLTMTSSTYASLFYLVIGMHGFHVFASILVLIYGFVYFPSTSSKSITHDGFTAIRVFWYFVVGIWPFLYVSVYLI
ncbi:MAG: heme/copper-type cytochrome/quinol oxidase subunit 3 [bacterium]|jgi:heme/copper-type cytochrome/quinol oxidase subunit 3